MGSLGDFPAAPGEGQPTRVLVIGGSYAGLSAALNLVDLCDGKAPRRGNDEGESFSQLPVEVTIVDERDGFLHLIGCPLAMASKEYAEKAWVRFDDIPALQHPSIRLVHGSVRSVDPTTKTARIVLHGGGDGDGGEAMAAATTTTTRDQAYDYLVASTGLRRVFPVVPQSLLKKQYRLEAGAHVDAVGAARHGVLVVGGGAVGIEMAAELKLVRPRLQVTLAHSRAKLLSSEALPDHCKDASLECLRDAGVDVLLQHRLEGAEEVADGEGGRRCRRARFANGHTMLADHVVMAMSKSAPSTAFLPREAVDHEGYVKVNADLSFASAVADADCHFGAGDMILWSGIKRCGAAMHEGYFAGWNVYQKMLATATGKTIEVKHMNEIPPMIALAVGKKAVACPWGGEDTTATGEDIMQVFFNDDLGFKICWNFLGLGPKIV